jgi:hypothetical protein
VGKERRMKIQEKSITFVILILEYWITDFRTHTKLLQETQFFSLISVGQSVEYPGLRRTYATLWVGIWKDISSC